MGEKFAVFSDIPWDKTLGVDPKYGQVWDVSNVFVSGASLFPQNAGYNPTGTVGALTYHTASAVLTRYLKAPGALV